MWNFLHIICHGWNHHTYCLPKIGTDISASPDVLIPALLHSHQSYVWRNWIIMWNSSWILLMHHILALTLYLPHIAWCLLGMGMGQVPSTKSESLFFKKLYLMLKVIPNNSMCRPEWQHCSQTCIIIVSLIIWVDHFLGFSMDAYASL